MSFTGPGAKPTWDISESEPGTIASKDPGALELIMVPEVDEIEFGIFLFTNLLTDIKVRPPNSGDVSISGVSLLSNSASDYKNRKYSIDDEIVMGMRGFYWIKTDPANPPNLGIARVSHKAGIKGYLTSDASDSFLVSVNMVTRVYENVAEIFLVGAAFAGVF